jgi:hypothetical protein
MRLLKAGELGVVAGGFDDEFADFGDDDFGLDGVTVRGRRPKKERRGLLGELFDRWGEVFNPATGACPNASAEMFVANEKLQEVVVEAKKISAEQVNDYAMLWPQPTTSANGSPGWTGLSDMTEAWRDLFSNMSTENPEALRQALAEVIANANAVNNAFAVGRLCDMVGLIVSAMNGRSDNGNLGYQFGSALFHVRGLGVSFEPLTRAFIGR